MTLEGSKVGEVLVEEVGAEGWRIGSVPEVGLMAGMVRLALLGV